MSSSIPDSSGLAPESAGKDAGGRQRRRRRVAAAVVVIAGAAAALAVTDPFQSSPPASSGVADNSYPTQLTTIKQQPISSQTPQSATLGYAGSYSVSLPSGTTTAAVSADQSTLHAAQTKVTQDEQTLAAARTVAATQGAATLLGARNTLAIDEATLAAARAQLARDAQLGCPASSAATMTAALGSTSPGAGIGAPSSSAGSPASSAGSPSSSPGSPHSGAASGPTGASDPPSSSTTPSGSAPSGSPGPSTDAGGTTTTTIPAPVAPLVTLAAPSASSTTAAFSGTVDPGGAATTYRFLYGATASFGSSTPAGTLPAGHGAQSVNATIAHLEPGVPYLVELEATNAVGTTLSPPQTFSTLQSSCEAQRLVVASDVQAVTLAADTVASDQATAGTTLSQDEQLLASDEQQVITDGEALSLAEAQQTNSGSRFTWLPSAGQRIGRGQRVYDLDGRPVPLLYGTTTPYRALDAGTGGPDVAEPQANLTALGLAPGLRADGRFGEATAQAVKAWQAALGLPETGIVSLGDVVVEPGPIRVETIGAALGQAAQPGGPVLTASSTEREVTIALDASQQSELKVGDPVTITLPGNSSTPGVISSVGTVATAPSSGSGPTGGGTPTITVEVTPTDPAATGNLDQAPVTVSITTGSVASALVVPVDALLSLSGGGYGVEEVTNGVHHIVTVTLGLFDDADGIVQVSGPGLAAGQHVVVPAL